MEDYEGGRSGPGAHRNTRPLWANGISPLFVVLGSTLFQSATIVYPHVSIILLLNTSITER